MFLGLVSAMRKYWTDAMVSPFVVSKTGLCGRRELVDPSLASSYGIGDLQVCDYQHFDSNQFKDCTVFHHVLGHTRPIIFPSSCRYIVVNHTNTNITRLPKFKPYCTVCVSEHFTTNVKAKTRLKPLTILNGCEDYYDTQPSLQDPRLKVGRCQRVVPTKFRKERIDVNCVHYVVGPVKSEQMLDTQHKFLGPVFDKHKKLSLIKSFDVYLHDSQPEGASMAVLEALSCGTPVVARDVGGGIRELVIHKRNGYLFRDGKQLNHILQRLTDKNKLQDLKQSVRRDFLERLHIKHSLNHYRKLLLA